LPPKALESEFLNVSLLCYLLMLQRIWLNKIRFENTLGSNKNYTFFQRDIIVLKLYNNWNYFPAVPKNYNYI